MKISGNRKKALLAALSLTVAAGAMTAATAAHAQPPAVTIEAPAAVVGHAADEAQIAKSLAAKLGVAGALTAGLAALVRLIGVGRIAGWLRQAGPAVGKAAKTAAKAPVMAIKAVGRAVASPVRFALLVGALGLFALTGVGLYDIEWIGGLVAGAALAITAWVATSQTRQVFQRRPIRVDAKKDGRE